MCVTLSPRHFPDPATTKKPALIGYPRTKWFILVKVKENYIYGERQQATVPSTVLTRRREQLSDRDRIGREVTMQITGDQSTLPKNGFAGRGVVQALAARDRR